MNLEELQIEYSTQLIGSSLYGIIQELCGQIAHKYPERIYNSGLSWDGQSIEDLCQEVVLNQLLGQHQIHYIFDSATSVESVRRLLTVQIKRALLARRKVTPIDRLLKRVTDLARDGEVDFVDGTPAFYRARTSPSEYQSLEATQIYACVRAAAGIPRLDSRLDTARETMIYTPDRLKILMKVLFEAVPAISEKDLRDIFEILLTPWTPASLIPIEKAFADAVLVIEDPLEEEQMAKTAQDLANSFTQAERVVLILKSQNVADTAVAAEVGVSRPTIADMKKAVLSRVREELVADLPELRHEKAMQYLLEECNFLSHGVGS